MTLARGASADADPEEWIVEIEQRQAPLRTSVEVDATIDVRSAA